MKKVLFSLLVAATSYGANAQFTEGFDDLSSLVNGGGWEQISMSNPVGTQSWYQGFPAGTNPSAYFPAYSGDTATYAGNGFLAVDGSGTISEWLLTPALNMANGDTLSFWTRTGSFGGTIYPDRLQVRAALSGTTSNVGADENSVGDFAILLAEINPDLTTTDYPEEWTRFEYIPSALPVSPMSVRGAFRYFVADGGANGANSGVIGIDDVQHALGPNGVDVKATDGKLRVTVAPNPVSENLSITWSTPLSSDATVVVLDNSAKYLLQERVQSGSTQANYDVSSLPTGTYIVQIYSRGSIFATNFVKL